MVNLKNTVFGVKVIGVGLFFLFILGRVHGMFYNWTLRYLLKY